VAEVLDAEGNTYPDGLAVTFEHRPLGGSTVSDPVASPACAAAPCVQSITATDGSGLARVRLYSGTVAGVVRVAATAVAGGTTRRFDMPSIAIVGAKPNAGHFSIICGVANVPALAGDTCHVSTIEAPFTCTAFLNDRYNNMLGRATTVSFMSEVGEVGPPAVTPEYDPGSPPDSQGQLGSAVNIINTLGKQLPKDVEPYPTMHAHAPALPPPYFEESVAVPGDPCGQTVHNPRDGVATVVAWTEGEEAFSDTDGDGAYDLGEPFIDLPEPFVDYDDDDFRDDDEPMIDTNANGVWDPPNGRWDSSSNIWTKTVVVYTGMPAFMEVGGLDYLSRWMEPIDLSTYPGGTPLAAFDVRPEFDPETFTDCNGNGTWDANAAEPFVDCNGDKIYNPAGVAEAYTDVNGSGTWDTGEPFADCNGNGLYDTVAMEPFTDCNKNASWDASIAEAYVDVNGDGIFNAFKLPATTETLLVTASDDNLNRLCDAAQYGVTTPEGVTFTAEYKGKPALPDRYGFDFGFQPCNGTSPTSCSFDCPAVAPVSGQCVMRTRVDAFSSGYGANVLFTGGAVGDADGATSADWEIELFGELLKITVSGTHE
jgi:hypothetical protein